MKPIIVNRKSFSFFTPTAAKVEIDIALEKGCTHGFIERVDSGIFFIDMIVKYDVRLRTEWENCDLEAVIQDIEFYTRPDQIYFASLGKEIRKLKVRDYFELSTISNEERKNIFKLWYSTEARQLTHRFQFPKLKNGVFRPVPPEEIFGKNKLRYN